MKKQARCKARQQTKERRPRLRATPKSRKESDKRRDELKKIKEGKRNRTCKLQAALARVSRRKKKVTKRFKNACDGAAWNRHMTMERHKVDPQWIERRSHTHMLSWEWCSWIGRHICRTEPLSMKWVKVRRMSKRERSVRDGLQNSYYRSEVKFDSSYPYELRRIFSVANQKSVV